MSEVLKEMNKLDDDFGIKVNTLVYDEDSNHMIETTTDLKTSYMIEMGRLIKNNSDQAGFETEDSDQEISKDKIYLNAFKSLPKDS